MTTLLPFLIVGWLGVAVVLFRRLPAPVAVLGVVVVGQLFLPEIQLPQRVPEAPLPLPLPIVRFTKTGTLSYALLLGSLLFDRRRWAAVYPRWYDLPMALWCVAPLISSIVNEIGPLGGLYDGAVESLQQTLTWGVPYWFGRLYLGSRDGLRALATAVVLGGLAYVPLCLVEMRFSPQLHRWVYGFHQHDFIQAIRAGGYRPMVFLEHGLAVALWMAVAALVAFWLWWEGVYRWFRLPGQWSVPVGLLVLVLAATAALCRSVGALILGLGGVAVLLTSRYLRTALPLIALAAVPPAYVVARYTEAWTAKDLVDWTRARISPERAESLDFRLRNETLLLKKAKERPVFGWGGWGRSRIIDVRGEDRSVTDSLWIITLGTTGGFGLTMLLTALLLPIVRFLWHAPPRHWSGAADAPAAALAVAFGLHVNDCLFNAMLNPVFMLAAGALAGAAARLGPAQADRAAGAACPREATAGDDSGAEQPVAHGVEVRGWGHGPSARGPDVAEWVR
jgi:hypothetical protein